MEIGTVPEDRKVTCIVRIYKKIGDKSECANYRSVNILSIL